MFLLSLSQFMTSCAENTAVPVTGESFYATEIQPIMTASCAFSGSHGGGSALTGIKLDTYADVMASSGAVLGK